MRKKQSRIIGRLKHAAEEKKREESGLKAQANYRAILARKAKEDEEVSLAKIAEIASRNTRGVPQPAPKKKTPNRTARAIRPGKPKATA